MQLVLFITNCMNINLSFFLAFLFFKKLASHLLADLNSFSARVNWFSGAFSMWLMTPTMLFSLPTAEYVLSSFSSSSNRDTVMLMSRSVKRDVSIVCWNSCSAISSAEPEIQETTCIILVSENLIPGILYYRKIFGPFYFRPIRHTCEPVISKQLLNYCVNKKKCQLHDCVLANSRPSETVFKCRTTKNHMGRK